MENHPEKGHILLHHEIFKHSNGYPEPMPILSISETIDKKNSSWYKSIFSEVIHVFQKLDKINVESAVHELIDIDGKPWTKNLLTIQYVSRIRD